MTGKLENNDYTLASIFDDSVFQIPDYQRYYSWERPQYSDLWEDLMNVLRRKKREKGDIEHYMGTLICQENGRVERTKGVTNLYKYDVVDGQQRLTSLVLLLRAIFDRYESLDKDDTVLDGARERYIRNSKITDDKTKMRLQGEDETVFRSLVKHGEARQIETPSQRRLLEAYEFFTDKLKDAPAEGFGGEPDLLLELLETINELQFMVYTIESREKATLIFESVNDRGKDLSNLEKTKSFLMHKLYLTLPEADVKDELYDIQDDFRQIYNALQTIEDSDWVGSVSEDRIQRYHFIASMPKQEIIDYHEEVGNKHKTRKEGASEYLEIIKWWFDHLHDADDDECAEKIKEYTASLRDFFVSYEDIIQRIERNEGPAAVRRELKKLFVLGRVANLYPIILAAWDEYRDQNTGELVDLLDVIETAAFRIYAVGNRRSNTGRNRFYKIAYRFFKQGKDIEQAIEELVNVVQRYEDDKTFKQDLKGDVYEEMSAGDIRYLLYFYDKHQQTENMDTDWDTTLKEVVRNNGKEDYSIDHIWPQDDSKLELSESEVEEREQNLHRLGNLTIVTARQNAKWKNNPYGKKKDRYAESNFLITRKVLDYADNDTWNTDTIAHRSEDIVKFAVENWALPQSS